MFLRPTGHKTGHFRVNFSTVTVCPSLSYQTYACKN